MYYEIFSIYYIQKFSLEFVYFFCIKKWKCFSFLGDLRFYLNQLKDEKIIQKFKFFNKIFLMLTFCADIYNNLSQQFLDFAQNLK